MRYRRVKIPGMKFFFTVNLADRTNNLLINNIAQLKVAFSMVKLKHPFKTDAMVVLLKHLHMIMTLPDEDDNYSQKWNLIKGHFSRMIEKTENISLSRNKKRERRIWGKDGFGSILFKIKMITNSI